MSRFSLCPERPLGHARSLPESAAGEMNALAVLSKTPRFRASRKDDRAVQTINRPFARGALLDAGVGGASHRSLAVSGMQSAARIAEKRSPPGAAVRLRRRCQFKFRRRALRAGSGYHIAKGVAVLRARGGFGVEHPRRVGIH